MRPLSVLLLSLSLLTAACTARDLNTKPDPAPTSEPASAPAVDEKPALALVAADDNLNATLWLQSSAERKGLSLQTWASASLNLDEALKDKKWTSAPEQVDVPEADLKKLKPAIVVDVDETVLDNSFYQARLVQQGASFAPETWTSWVAERKATAVPGAVEFLKQADTKGVTIFYVTNRTKPQEEDTRANLAALGFPLDKDGVDCVLTVDEQEGWGSAKGTRRKHIAQTHRILFLVGDNLGDFTDDYQGDMVARDAQIDKYAAWWGQRWFVLPNPSYGSWESAILGKERDPAARHGLRLKALKANP